METPEVRSRKDARILGLRRYFTGVSCGRGHTAERFVSTRACVECAKLHLRAIPPERRRAYVAAFRSGPVYQEYLNRSAAVRIAKAKASAKRNPESVKAAKRRWNHANAHLWRDYYASHAKRCRSAQPSWLTAEQKAEIRAFYREAASRPDGPWHVDHIVPLRGATVCGLHVPWNLRIISAHENLSKGSALIEEIVAV